MATTLQRYLGNFTIGTDRRDFTVGGSGVELTTGDYFMSGVAGEVQFVDHMQVQIRALGPPYDAATVTQSVTNGTININLGSAADIVWTDADLGLMLGFDAALTGSDAYTSENQARYGWFPNRGLSDFPGTLVDWWAPNSTSRVYRSASGQTYSRIGNNLDDARVEYQNLSELQTWKKGSAWWDAFEAFFDDVVHLGNQFRCFPDRELNTTSDDYHTAIWQPEEGKPVGSMRDFSARNLANFNGFWTLTLSMFKHVT